MHCGRGLCGRRFDGRGRWCSGTGPAWRRGRRAGGRAGGDSGQVDIVIRWGLDPGGGEADEDGRALGLAKLTP